MVRIKPAAMSSCLCQSMFVLRKQKKILNNIFVVRGYLSIIGSPISAGVLGLHKKYVCIKI
jgi:hypothetical protein